MTRAERDSITQHMLLMMRDSAHDCEHVWRVVRMSGKISAHYPEADEDILFAAACLHDIGRDAQYKDPKADHAQVGSEMAYAFLLTLGWDEPRAAHVRDCIRTHRYRGNDQPATIEAKILFDSDKLDATGAMGIARTLVYQGIVGAPIYEPREIEDDNYIGPQSFLAEYRRKLRHCSARLYTDYAKEIAKRRDEASIAFTEALLRETRMEDC